jgi:HD superfamily phosphohydrolase
LSVIKSVLDGRNFLNRWVYSHHTVVYYNHVLNGALLSLDQALSDGGEGTLIDAIFSEESYEKPVCVGTCCLYLPCDDDIFSLLKMHAADTPHVKELMSRKPDLVPLWKTQAEFELIFKDKGVADRAYVQDRVGEKLAAVLGVPSDSEHILMLPVTPSVVPIEESNLFVNILNDVISLARLAAVWEEVGKERRNVSFFYVYIPREFKNRISDCIEALKAPVR